MIELIKSANSRSEYNGERTFPYCYSSAWCKLYKNVFKYDLKHYCIKKDDVFIGEFSYVIIKSFIFGSRIVSMPLSDEGGIVLKKNLLLSEEDTKHLLSNIVALLDKEAELHKADLVEIRGYSPLMETDYAKENFTKINPYAKFTLDTSIGYENIRKRYNSNIIKNLKKADKCVEISATATAKEISKIYKIYLIQMRQFGSPPLPKKYFITLLNEKVVKIFIAREEKGTVIGFLMLFTHNNIVYADLNASLPEYNNYFPKVKLFDESIKWACQDNVKLYDFMRTRKNSGVFLHKDKWGGKEEPIDYYYRPYKKIGNLLIDPEQKQYSLYKFVFKKMPLFLLRLIGGFIRKNAGK